MNDSDKTNSIIWFLKHPLELLLCLLMAAIVIVTFSQVVFRYALEHSLSWSEETARFLFMWLTMLGAAYAFKLKSHFALEFLTKRFNEQWKKILNTSIAIVLTVFFVFFIWKGFYLIFTVAIDQVAPATQISVAIPYLSGPVGGIFMLYYILRNWWEDLRNIPRTSIE